MRLEFPSSRGQREPRPPDTRPLEMGWAERTLASGLGVVVTAANGHDKHDLHDLLCGKEKRVYGDSANVGQQALIEGKAPDAKNFNLIST